ncbi:MAG TPA: ribonuclease Z [Gemmatimonadota bacterium]|nr:ribonuclease Z [Gemmatimonadota bacterium]
MLRVTFLGTASSRPTVRRNVSSLFVQREGDAFLFDCGEGTQRQMMRFGVGFAFREIFLTHLHADHCLGVTGLLRTMSLQGREEPVVLWGPEGSAGSLRELVELGGDGLAFRVALRELPAGESVRYDGYRIEAFPTRHTRDSIGLVLVEEERLGRFDPARARALGVPEGPLFGRLHRGETVELPDGRGVEPEAVVGPPRPGRRLVYTGDTRPSDRTVEAARDADLLVHECTFGEAERDRARDTGHSTAREAARIAAEAGARRLALTHFSARYSEQAHRLRAEAESVFPGAVAAEDGTTLEVAFRDAPEAGGDEEPAGRS